MEIDQLDPQLEVTQSRPRIPSPEIVLVNQEKEDRIKVLVKEHVKNWKVFLDHQEKANKDGMVNTVRSAMESQKALQQLISKKEVEEYVKGWNPWVEIKKF